MDFIIKKLWGENTAELHKSSKNIYDDFIMWTKQAVVVSAIRSPDFNTTDKLIELGCLLKRQNVALDDCKEVINELKYFHLNILKQKLLCSEEKFIEVIESQFALLELSIGWYISQSTLAISPSANNDYSIPLERWGVLSILGFGEIVCCRIFSCVVDNLSSEWICSKSVDLSNIVMPEEVTWKTDEDLFGMLSERLAERIEEKIRQWFIPVLSWYMWYFDWWIEHSIGRGYSDATAAACTVWLSHLWHEVVLEIQKSVPGLMSADPRILTNSKDAVVLEKIDYLTTREITWECWAQAKLLHHQALRSQVQEAGVKIHLFDPFSETEGSWIVSKKMIDEQQDCDDGVSFIGWRKDVIFFSISSGKMFENGILARLFWIVQDYFWVDIVSASESEVSFTIDGKGVDIKQIDEMISKLRKKFNMPENSDMEFIEYSMHKSLVFCVWMYMKGYIWLFARATKVLSDNKINIEIGSQWRLQRAMIFWIDEKDMKKAVNVLHKEFISTKSC